MSLASIVSIKSPFHVSHGNITQYVLYFNQRMYLAKRRYALIVQQNSLVYENKNDDITSLLNQFTEVL